MTYIPEDRLFAAFLHMLDPTKEVAPQSEKAFQRAVAATQHFEARLGEYNARQRNATINYSNSAVETKTD